MNGEVIDGRCVGIMAAKPIKVLFRCVNGYYSFVRIKGLFKQTAFTEWYISADILEETEEGGPHTYSNGSQWITFDTPIEYTS